MIHTHTHRNTHTYTHTHTYAQMDSVGGVACWSVRSELVREKDHAGTLLVQLPQGVSVSVSVSVSMSVAASVYVCVCVCVRLSWIMRKSMQAFYLGSFPKCTCNVYMGSFPKYTCNTYVEMHDQVLICVFTNANTLN